MGSPQLGNCTKCGKLFLHIRDLCNDCYQKQEADFLKVSTYLRNQSGSTIQELSDATKVSIAQIRQFILAGRILVGEFTNLSYPCQTCGNMIKTGRLCSSCIASINKLRLQDEKEDRSDERTGKTGGYITNYL